MFFTKRKKEQSVYDGGITEDTKLTKSLETNISMFKALFKDDGTIRFREFQNQAEDSVKCCIIFIDGMISNQILNQNIIWPVVRNDLIKKSSHVLDELEHQVIVSNDISRSDQVFKLAEAIVYGDTVFLVDGIAEGLDISTKGWQIRSISEPEAERVMRGPREGFTETILVNLSMIRRKILTPELKFKFRTFGETSRTKACICYVDGIVNEKILKEFESRLDKVELQGALDSEYIRECITDAPLSPLITVGSTERPDVVAGKLLEGRVALLVDGSPVAITAPYLFAENLQTSEDYYLGFLFSSVNRIIRMISFFLTISIPALYLSLVTYHQEMIPTPLLMSISGSRQGVPFPSVVEMLGLLFVFELLREAGTRTPGYIGQALSIVGALILGQAAVEAKFISIPMVIIVAVTGVTGLIVPTLRGLVFFARFGMLIASSFLGLYGYVFGLAVMVVHLCNVHSFGVPYLTNLNMSSLLDIQDTTIRAPWWVMKYRPKFLLNVNHLKKGFGGRKP